MKKNVKKTRKTGEAASPSPAGNGTDGSVSGTAIELDSIATGSSRSNRCKDSPPLPGGEPTIIIHETEGGELRPTHARCTKTSPHVHAAMRLLRELGYQPAKIAESSVPLSIIGFLKADPLLVLIISSRKPVPSARRLHEDFEDQVRSLCALAGSVRSRIMIWVYSRPCGWRYYDVYPGGLWLSKDMMEPEKK